MRLDPICVQIIVVSLVSAILIIVGAVYWSNDEFTDQSIKHLIAIPFTPSLEDNNTYIVTNETNQSLSSIENFVLDISNVKDDLSYSFRIIHNMLGYNITLNILEGDLVQHRYSNAFNTDKKNLTINFKDFDELGFDLSKIHSSFDDYKVLCPSSSLITNISGIGNKCKEEEAKLEIEGSFTYFDIGIKIPLEKKTHNAVFHKSSFIKANNSEIPQAYLGVFSIATPTASKGMVITIIGIVIFVGMIIEFILTCVKHVGNLLLC